MNFAEESHSPLDKVECVNIVDILLPLIHLPLYPMTIEVSEEVVDVFRSGCISVPFSDVETKESFIGVCLRLVHKVFEIGI